MNDAAREYDKENESKRETDKNNTLKSKKCGKRKMEEVAEREKVSNAKSGATEKISFSPDSKRCKKREKVVDSKKISEGLAEKENCSIQNCYIQNKKGSKKVSVAEQLKVLICNAKLVNTKEKCSYKASNKNSLIDHMQDYVLHDHKNIEKFAIKMSEKHCEICNVLVESRSLKIDHLERHHKNVSDACECIVLKKRKYFSRVKRHGRQCAGLGGVQEWEEKLWKPWQKEIMDTWEAGEMQDENARKNRCNQKVLMNSLVKIITSLDPVESVEFVAKK